MLNTLFALFLLLSGLVPLNFPAHSQARDRVAGDFERADENSDGKLNRKEWQRRGSFTRLDTDADEPLSLAEVRAIYEGHSVKSYDWPPVGLNRSPAEIDPGAAGTVVGKFMGEQSPRGIEIVIRHSPKDSGLPLWIYTGYTHLDKMPELEVGQRVGVGEIIGPTGNSRVSGKGRKKKSKRRPAVHFSAFFSETRQYAIRREIVVPVNGRWLDPIALYRQKHPMDSDAMRALPEDEKEVPIQIKFEDEDVIPPGTKFVWPYICKRG